MKDQEDYPLTLLLILIQLFYIKFYLVYSKFVSQIDINNEPQHNHLPLFRLYIITTNCRTISKWLEAV